MFGNIFAKDKQCLDAPPRMPSAIFGRLEPIAGGAMPVSLAPALLGLRSALSKGVRFARARDRIGQSAELGGDFLQQEKLLVGLPGGSDDGDGPGGRAGQQAGNRAQHLAQASSED